MALSEYEQKQFELLTASLDFGDSVALKEMKRRDKVAAKGVASPRRKLWTLALIWFGVAIIPAVFFYWQFGSILHAFLILAFFWVFMMATETVEIRDKKNRFRL